MEDTFDRDERASDWFHSDNDYSDHDIADVKGYYPKEYKSRHNLDWLSGRKSSGNSKTGSSGNDSSSPYYSASEDEGLDADHKFYDRFKHNPLGLDGETAKISGIQRYRIPINIVASIINALILASSFNCYYEYLPFLLLAIPVLMLWVCFSIAKTVDGNISESIKLFEERKKYFGTLSVFALINEALMIAGLIQTDFTITYLAFSCLYECPIFLDLFQYFQFKIWIKKGKKILVKEDIHEINAHQ